MNLYELLLAFIIIIAIYKVIELIAYTICWVKSDNKAKEKFMTAGIKYVKKPTTIKTTKNKTNTK